MTTDANKKSALTKEERIELKGLYEKANWSKADRYRMSELRRKMRNN